MKKIKSETGSITLFMIVAFIFCMIMLVALYWNSTNNQITVLQSEQRIKELYGEDVNNVESTYQEIKRIESERAQNELENEIVDQETDGNTSTEEDNQVDDVVNDETSTEETGN